MCLSGIFKCSCYLRNVKNTDLTFLKILLDSSRQDRDREESLLSTDKDKQLKKQNMVERVKEIKLAGHF
jgi:hypothetical protein